MGKSLRELDFRARFGVNVVEIQKRVPFITNTGETEFRIESNDLPNPDGKLEAGDILMVVGSAENIEQLARADEGEE